MGVFSLKKEEVTEIVDDLIQTVQKQTGLVVAKIYLGEDRPEADVLNCLFLFEGGKRLDSRITVSTAGKQLAFRIQGNFV